MKKHQDAVYWVDIDLAIRKGMIMQHPSRNTSSLLYSKSCKIEDWQVLYEKACMSPRPPPKISLRHDWTRGKVQLGSTVDQQPEGKLFDSHEEKFLNT